MNLLITGAFPPEREDLEFLHSHGYLIDFQQDERAITENPEKYDAVICNGLFLYNRIENFGNLKIIQLTSAGKDRVDEGYIKNKGIRLFNAGNAYSVPMAEWAVSGILNIYKNSGFFYENKKNRLWQKDRTVRELNGSNVLIFGYGNTGREAAKKLSAFGCKITASDIVKNDLTYADDFCFADNSDKALSEADIVILTLPLNKQTEKFINYRRLSVMKKDAVLVNISRGAVIDENALCNSLKNGNLAGAVLDVFEKEPLPENSFLWNCDRVFITPHNSFVSDKNHSRLFEIIKHNLLNEV